MRVLFYTFSRHKCQDWLISKFRNKSEYSMTHMLNPTLVKLNMYDLSQVWINSKWILLDREYIRDISQNKHLFLYLPVVYQYPWVLSFQAILYREDTFSWNVLLSFWVASTQFIFFPWRRTTCKSLSKKTTIKTLSSILYHRWAEIE